MISLHPIWVMVLCLATGAGAGLVMARVLSTVLGHVSPESTTALRQRLRAPSMLFLPLVVIKVVDPEAGWATPAAALAAQATHMALIVAVAWLLMRVVSVSTTLIGERLARSDGKGPALRRTRTQVAFLRRFLDAVIAVVALALILMSFTAIRNLGTSILASAGAAGIIFGIAAQRSIGNVVAGFQMLFTQALRIDDAVVVEGEWGTVEELTLTYVVVRLWDLRRLILPITYFIEKPFQNWTRSSSNIIGTVYLWVDFDTDVQALRTMFLEIVNASPHWDRGTARLQVTDASETGMQIRALMSAADAGRLWDLRCEVREALFTRLRTSGQTIWPQRRFRELKMT